MKHTFTRISVLVLLLLPFLSVAQVQTSQQSPTIVNNPQTGVPGACGNNANAKSGNPSPQNGNGTLGLIYDQQKCGLDYAYATQRLGKRFSPAGVNQPAPFAISGIPSCAIIEKAYFWAEGSGNGAAQTATIVNPASASSNFPMTIVGSGMDKCWGYSGTYTYRADVTSCISGNGTYNISGILTNPPTSGNDMDGGTLIVIWSLPSATWAGRIAISDGAIVVNGGVANYNIPLSPAVCGATSNARAFFGVGDIQFNPTSWTANGTAVPLTWNWWNFEQVATTVPTGATSSGNYNINTGGDCFNLCIAGLYFRTTTCTTCPSTTALTVTTSQTPATCSNCNGSATVSVSPAGSYTYSWSPAPGGGQGTATATGLCAGTYTCTITSGCITQTQTFNIVTSGGSLTMSGAITNVGCYGQCTGSAVNTVSGGTAPYTFSWSPAATNSTVGSTNTGSNLCAGTYTVTVTDAGGCTGTRTITITQPPAITLTPTSTNIQCNGQCTGTASVTASGGTGSYTYVWSPSAATTASVSALCAGTYTCTVTSGPAGCTSTQTFNITQVPAITATQTQTNVVCNGQCNGSAAVVASGGTGSYTYSWTPTGGTGATATGLCPGTYTCTITSGPAGCTITKTFSITQPPAITLTPTQTNVTCNGQCTGTASVTATGGPGPYSYSWAPTAGTSASITGLCAGTYTCTVTSNPGGCTAQQTFSITQPPAITATQTQTNILCNGQCTGAASVVASGGTGTFSYSWSPTPGAGQGTANATSLCAGTYTCTITSGPAGCTITKTFNITQPPALAATTSATNATCGSNNGAASISVSGGTPGYTYAWTPSGSGSNPTGLGAGSYVVTVTDANGCTLTRTITITNAGSPTATITASANVSCFGGSNGSATVSASGGTGPYTYDWAPGSPTGDGTPSVTGLTVGTWSVTVTDANNCSTTVTVNITQPPAFTSTAVATPVLCNGGSTGTASVSTTGGAGGNTYNWAPGNPPGDGTAGVTGLIAGSWSVTVTDVNGCTTTATVNVTQPTALAAPVTATAVSCFGGTNGAATVTASGGTPAYTYDWAPGNPTGDGTPSVSGLTVGTWSVTVTDNNGCTITTTVAVTQPTALSATTSFTQATCGSSNGSAAVSASGGTGTYTYSWSPTGGSSSTATGLPAGPYTCLITDQNGCTFTASVSVPNAGSPTATITSQTNVSCFGGNNGSATVSATGGTTPYTYAWSPTGGTGATGSPLSAGPYTVTVTDFNGCSTTATVNITEPAALTATATSTAVLCNGGNTGSASVSASGGTGTYTYSWSPTGGSAATASNLTAGPYTCVVTDQNGCTFTASVSVTQPPALSVTTSTSPALCFGGNTGSASVTVTGGSPTYTYSWSPTGGNSAGATSLTAQPYTCLVTDLNGCTFTASVTVTQPTALAATTSFTQATCGSSNGSAAVSVSGGSPTYTYSWSPTGGSAATATGLPAGPYTCLITDLNGCTFTASVTVPNASSPTATIVSVTNVSCFGGNDGAATVSVSGGSPGYTYSWSPIGGTGATGTNLTAQNYVVTVSDLNGCTTTATVAITEPPLLTATATSSPVLCFGGSTGSATLTPTGGTPGYTYSWSPSGGGGPSASNLPAGPYTCVVTDANGCTASASTTVTEPTALTATASMTPVSCSGGNNGTATVSASGGTATYTYSWSPTGGSLPTASNLTAQPYTCLVTDLNGCTFTASVTVTEPPALTATTSFTQSTCSSANGSAAVSASGGTPSYSYTWTPSGGTGATESNIAAGNYSCVISDAKGCTLTVTVNVPNAASPLVSIIASDSVSCSGGSDGWAACSSSGGTTPYTYLWSNNDADTLAGGLSVGTYTVTVTDANGCSSSDSVTIGEPPLLTISATSTDVLCNGGSTGTASSTASGGTGSYTYNWSPSGGSNANANNLSQATYTVLVTDANGCTAQATTIVSEPPLLTITATMTPVLCNGGNTGTATGTAVGGLGTYTYTWTPTGGNNSAASNLSQGTYSITVTDQNGCTAQASTTVTEPSALTLSTSAVDAHCNLSDGSVTATGGGGTGTLSYQWTNANGPATPSWNSIPSGTYSVTITDQNGCTITSSQAVLNLNGVNATLNSSTNLTCFNSADGAIDVDATGGVGPYTYTWTPNVSSTDVANSIAAGNYTIVVADSSGCTSTVNVLLTEPSLLTVQASANPSVVCAGTPVALTSSAGGGTPGYSYDWNPGALSGQNQNVTPLSSTTYTVTVTDANGCTATSPVLVTVNAMPVVDFSASDTAGCEPLCVTFTDLSTVSSGTITGWFWDIGDNTTSTQQSPAQHCYPAGNYDVTLTVTTNAGCTQTITLANYITVYPMAVANFGYSPQPTTILNPVIQFSDSSINAAQWLWSFGDVNNSSSTLQNPSYEYTEPDCYVVWLTVTSPDGCVDDDSDIVCIDPDVTIYVPNTFTPDDNGLNDVFIPVAIGIDEDQYELWIFDRWGNMIFYTDDLYKGWDGKVQGSSELCQIDTYVWKIKCRDVLDKRHDLIGHVNLIR